MPRGDAAMTSRPDTSSTRVDDERKYEGSIRRDKDDQKQQAHEAKLQSKMPHASEIRDLRAHESEMRDRFFHTDYSERTGLTPAERLAKMSHDATLISEDRAKAEKLVEQDESAEFWEKERASQPAQTSPKGQKKTISAAHDEVVPSSKVSHSTSKPDEVGVQETSIDATEQVPKGRKQQKWEAREPEAKPESVVKHKDDTSSAAPQEASIQQPSQDSKVKQSLWSFKKTNAGSSLDQHDEDHPSEGKVSKIDRGSSKSAESGAQEDAVDAKDQVPKGRKQKDVEPRDKLEDAEEDSSAWPPQDSMTMRRAMKEAQAQMRKSGVSSGAGSQTASDMQERLKREKEGLDKTLEYRQKKLLPGVEEWHADADNRPSTRDRETLREQIGHVADSIMHPFAHSNKDEQITQRPLVAAPQPMGQKSRGGESHSTAKPDEVGVQETSIDATEQVPKGRKQQKWEAQSPDAAPKSVLGSNSGISGVKPASDHESLRDRIGHVADRIIHPFSQHKTSDVAEDRLEVDRQPVDRLPIDRLPSVPIERDIALTGNPSHTMDKPDEVGVLEVPIDAKEIVPQGRNQKLWEALTPEAAPKSVKLNYTVEPEPMPSLGSLAPTPSLGVKEHEIQVDASPSGVHLKGVQGENKSAGVGLIDRIEDKLDSWKDEAGSKLSDLKHRIQGDAEIAKDKSVELKDRAVDRGEQLLDRAREQGEDLKDRFDSHKESWSSYLKRKESGWNFDVHSKEASLKSKARDLKADVVEDVNSVGDKIGALKDKAVNKVEEIGAEVKKEVGDFGTEIKKGTSSVLGAFSNQKGDEMDPIVEIQREREMAKMRGFDRQDSGRLVMDRDNKAHERPAGLFSRFRGWWSPKSRSAQVEAERDAHMESLQDDSKPDWPNARRTTQWERDNAINQSLLEPDRMQAKLDELRTTERSSAPAGGLDSKWNPKHTFAGDIRSSLASSWSNLKNKTGEPTEEALPDDIRTWRSTHHSPHPPVDSWSKSVTSTQELPEREEIRTWRSTHSPHAPVDSWNKGIASTDSLSKSVAATESKFERHFTSVPHPSSFSPSLSDVTPSSGPSIISYRASSPKPMRAYTEKIVVADQPRHMQPVDFDAIAFDAAIEPW